MVGMFEHCCSISLMPNIGKWNTSSVINMNSMFKKCESLCKFPDISKWNTTNVADMRDMFNNCISLSLEEEIFKMDIDNLSADFFNECINFPKNKFDDYIDMLYEKMVEENEFGREIIEQIYDEFENCYYVSCFFNKFDMVKFIIKYQCDKNKLEEWLGKFL